MDKNEIEIHTENYNADRRY